MSVSLSLFNVTPDLRNLPFEERVLALCADTTEPFGSRTKVIECLCSVPEFFHDIREDERGVERWDEWGNEGLSGVGSELPIFTHLTHQYRHHQQQGRVLRYLAQGNPVNCISVSRFHIDGNVSYHFQLQNATLQFRLVF